VRFRNIWVRELGRPGKKEFTLPESLLNSYTGNYDRGENDQIEITKENHQLVAKMGGVRFVMFAESPIRFFAKTTDFQLEFPSNNEGKVDRVVWSVGEGRISRRENSNGLYLVP